MPVTPDPPPDSGQVVARFLPLVDVSLPGDPNVQFFLIVEIQISGSYSYFYLLTSSITILTPEGPKEIAIDPKLSDNVITKHDSQEVANGEIETVNVSTTELGLIPGNHYEVRFEATGIAYAPVPGTDESGSFGPSYYQYNKQISIGGTVGLSTMLS